jgi:hypothetical protein
MFPKGWGISWLFREEFLVRAAALAVEGLAAARAACGLLLLAVMQVILVMMLHV